MSYRCHICNQYFRDTLDLINHVKERHKTSFSYVIIQYINSKFKRLQSFTDKDFSYILSFDLPKIIDRIISLEVSRDVFDDEIIPHILSKIEPRNIYPPDQSTNGTLECPPAVIEELKKDITAIKSLIFNASADVDELPFVPFGPGSDRRTKEYLMWATHQDRRKGSRNVKTGYNQFHQELMDELAPILERRKYELM